MILYDFIEWRQRLKVKNKCKNNDVLLALSAITVSNSNVYVRFIFSIFHFSFSFPRMSKFVFASDFINRFLFEISLFHFFRVRFFAGVWDILICRLSYLTAFFFTVSMCPHDLRLHFTLPWRSIYFVDRDASSQ